ncbi:MAG: hypothetical protein ABRQ37_18395 [Candidatus Eremiobacterota bacterium]
MFINAVTPKGNFISSFGSSEKFKYPVDIESDRQNNLYVLDAGKGTILKFSPKN